MRTQFSEIALNSAGCHKTLKCVFASFCPLWHYTEDNIAIEDRSLVAIGNDVTTIQLSHTLFLILGASVQMEFRITYSQPHQNTNLKSRNLNAAKGKYLKPIPRLGSSQRKESEIYDRVGRAHSASLSHMPPSFPSPVVQSSANQRAIGSENCSKSAARLLG